jgi:hypothetical protein
MIAIKTRFIAFAIVTMLLPAVTMAKHQAFTAASLSQIEQQYAGQPFLLVIWEVNCFPCREELALLGRLRQLHPDMNVSLLATDNISQMDEIAAILEANQLAGIDSWIFADPNIERLRYNIDPEWFGELPRNYFYDADSSRFGFSGKLTEEVLNEWLKGAI